MAEMVLKLVGIGRTERACRELLALPVFPELNEDQPHNVVQVVKEWFER